MRACPALKIAKLKANTLLLAGLALLLFAPLSSRTNPEKNIIWAARFVKGRELRKMRK